MEINTHQSNRHRSFCSLPPLSSTPWTWFMWKSEFLWATRSPTSLYRPQFRCLIKRNLYESINVVLMNFLWLSTQLSSFRHKYRAFDCKIVAIVTTASSSYLPTPHSFIYLSHAASYDGIEWFWHFSYILRQSCLNNVAFLRQHVNCAGTNGGYCPLKTFSIPIASNGQNTFVLSQQDCPQ